jgi:ribosomal protein L13
MPAQLQNYLNLQPRHRQVWETHRKVILEKALKGMLPQVQRLSGEDYAALFDPNIGVE